MEETKEKLLELVNACFNNKEFYSNIIADPSSGKVPKINCRYTTKSKYSIEQVGIKQTEYKGVAHPKHHSQSTDIDRDVFASKKQEYIDANPTKFSQEVYPNIVIEFSDNPPLEIYVCSESKELIKIGEFDVPILKYVRGNKFWISCLNTEGRYEKDGVAKFEVNIQPYEVYVKIKFGSLLDRITFDEMNELCETYINNKAQFKADWDMDKLNGRLRQYSK